MDKAIAILGAVALVLTAITAGMVVTSDTAGKGPVQLPPGYTGDRAAASNGAGDALAIARQYVMDDPTFQFDGLADTLKAELNTSGDPAIVTVFFTSRQAGYGNRTGLMLAQVLTPHECVLKISDGQVRSAIMDGVWDMTTQKEIKR